MRKRLKTYLIPDDENDYKPRIFGSGSLLLLIFAMLVVFASTVIETNVIRNDNQFLAAVLPGVLTTLANSDRAARGLPELRVNPLLEEAAKMKAEDMAAKEYFAHTSPEGLTPWVWISRAGYAYVHAGENLAVNFSESESVAHAWMNSPGHRDNILNPNYTEMGIATAEGVYKGKETVFVVQMFGAPARAPAVTAPTPVAVSPSVPESVEPQEEITTEAPIAAPVVTTEEPVAVADTEPEEAVDIHEDFLTDEPEVLAGTDEGGETLEGSDVTQVSGEEVQVISSGRHGFMYWFMQNPTLIMRIVYLAIMALIFVSLGVSVYRGISENLISNTLIAIGLMVLMIVLMYVAHRTMIPMLTLW